jgi:carbonic anhydrase
LKKLVPSWKKDLSASIVVFFVALPLCLGIGLASTSVQGLSPIPIAGILAGIVGGVVVGLFSNSRLGVSGPAAGLITVVVASISTLGSFSAFLLALVIAGLFQMVFAALRAGIIANYLPSSVIKGMLAAIGITLILKEIPHLIGYDKDYIGDEAFLQQDGHNTFTEILYAMQSLDAGVAMIGLVSLGLIILFEHPKIKKWSIFKFIPSMLWVILIGTLINFVLTYRGHYLAISREHLVQIPQINSWSDFQLQLNFPDLSYLTNPTIYIVALTIAAIASLETLLSVEAIDRLDPEKAITNPNRELMSQGFGNMVAGLIGGIPVTQVIVRSTANLNGGASSKMSAVYHGIWLIAAILFLAPMLNFIPLATLAAILIVVGYKLTNYKLIHNIYHKGLDQFIPFLTTIISILLTDLLKGIGIGLIVAIVFIIKRNFSGNHEVIATDQGYEIVFGEHVNFLNIASIKTSLMRVPSGAKVTINTLQSKSLDHDIQELLSDFMNITAKNKQIDVLYLGNHLSN